jgi:hypothetical protein
MVHLIYGDDRIGAARYYSSDLRPGELFGATVALARHLVAAGERTQETRLAWITSLLRLSELSYE